MNTRAVVLHPRLAAARGERVEQVRATCERLGASWTTAKAITPADGAAPVIVASLPAGSRVVPTEALEAAASADDKATLLLLADEPLVLPVVTLQRGRLVIVSPTASPERLDGLLTMLLGRVCPEGEPGRERLATRTWSAERGDATTLSRRGGFCALVPFDDGEPLTDARIELARGALDASSLTRLPEALGARAGLVHFSETPREWQIYWPRTDRPVWIHSPVRLPHVVELGAVAERAEGRIVRLPARSGDVALAVGGRLERSLHDVEKLMGEGGPHTFERVGRQVSPSFTALVAEVR